MVEQMQKFGKQRGQLCRAIVIIAVASLLRGPQPQALAQSDETAQHDRIVSRWVGARMNGLPIWLDFYGDSMLVISDNFNQFAADYALTPQTLVVYGDSVLMRVLATAFNREREQEDFSSRTSFEMRYRFSLERLLLQADGATITMTPQSVLARRIEVNWIADLPDSTQMQLRLDRIGNAGYRIVPGGSWVWGDWERDARDILFDWTPDSLETPDSTLIWKGLYDARGQQIVLEDTGEGTGTTIFRRIIR